MARKKDPTKELKNQRIPVMFTESELKAIDDWSFANRIRSRGEAIRRLCQLAMAFDQNVLDILGDSEKSVAFLVQALSVFPEVVKPAIDKKNHDFIADNLLYALLNSEKIMRILFEIIRQSDAIKSSESVESLQKAADERADAVKKIRKNFDVKIVPNDEEQKGG